MQNLQKEIYSVQNRIFYSLFSFPLGKIAVFTSHKALIHIQFIIQEKQLDTDYYIKRNFPTHELIESDTELLERAKIQLEAYMERKRRCFDLPILTHGTPFQTKVWDTLQNIPYGSVKRYGDIAKEIGNEKSYRAVGLACKQNPLPIIIPCHRVIATQGHYGGYRGGIAIKKWLLETEGHPSFLRT